MKTSQHGLVRTRRELQKWSQPMFLIWTDFLLETSIHWEKSLQSLSIVALSCYQEWCFNLFHLIWHLVAHIRPMFALPDKTLTTRLVRAVVKYQKETSDSIMWWKMRGSIPACHREVICPARSDQTGWHQPWAGCIVTLNRSGWRELFQFKECW